MAAAASGPTVPVWELTGKFTGNSQIARVTDVRAVVVASVELVDHNSRGHLENLLVLEGGGRGFYSQELSARKMMGKRVRITGSNVSGHDKKGLRGYGYGYPGSELLAVDALAAKYGRAKVWRTW